MSANWSLRNRLATALAMFGGVISLTLATIIYIASHDLEARLIDDTLTAELDDLVARRERNPQSLPEKTATIQAYVVAARNDTHAVPETVARLDVGRHLVTLDNRDYRAAVRQVGEQRFVVLYDISALEQRETAYLALLTLSVVLVTISSALTGRWLAAKIIAPVDELVRRVADLQPEDEPMPLASEFPWVEIHSLAEDFDNYLKRLHNFIERERLFTGDVSHELRTPLAVMRGATELLLADQSLDQRTRNRVARIARSVGEMSEITGALLALAREEGERSRLSEEDIESSVSELIEHYRELYQHKPVEIELKVIESTRIKLNHAVFSMVFGNLLRNALNFTDQGLVVVTIENNRIRILDNGPGLGNDSPENLFKPYVRGEHEQSGTGLGLSLVWRLCEQAGWEVSLSSRPGTGAVTQLTLHSPPQ